MIKRRQQASVLQQIDVTQFSFLFRILRLAADAVGFGQQHQTFSQIIEYAAG